MKAWIVRRLRGLADRIEWSGRKWRCGYRYECVVAFEWETCGRWVAEVTSCPGAIAYGSTQEEAFDAAVSIALRAEADRLHEEAMP